MNAALGGDFAFGFVSAQAELKALVTVSLTQTLSKSIEQSDALTLNVNLDGVENVGITTLDDHPVLPGQKVDRYRFMSFYLEPSTNHYFDFFNYVVDPEWLQRNTSEARALRQTQSGKATKPWRVLHRVTAIERPV